MQIELHRSVFDPCPKMPCVPRYLLAIHFFPVSGRPLSQPRETIPPPVMSTSVAIHNKTTPPPIGPRLGHANIYHHGLVVKPLDNNLRTPHQHSIPMTILVPQPGKHIPAYNGHSSRNYRDQYYRDGSPSSRRFRSCWRPPCSR